MSRFDFDKVIDRRGSDSIKWGRYAGRDILPLWVADMDFAAPPAVLDALHRRIDHGVFGYSMPWPSLIEAVQAHLQRLHGWRIEANWIVWIPGVVAAFNVACRMAHPRANGSGSGDAVFTHVPVYPPFLAAPGLSGRQLVTEPLQRNDAGWYFDSAATDAALSGSKAGLWLLCHPHNPVGHAWRDDELHEIARLAAKHDVIVCSDEIHCGLVLDDQRRHLPFAALSDDAAQRSITLMAPSKTFNLPGLYSAFAIIPDAQLRQQFCSVMDGIMPHVNTLGLVATEAAYRDCDDWLGELIVTLRGNARRVEASVAAMPGLTMAKVEATYLAWIDCREFCATHGIDHPQRFFERAGVGLSDGSTFGAGREYTHFVRLNFGCPRATLDEALRRMQAAVAAAR